MNVSLPRNLQQFVRRKVAAGDFQSVDEVVRKGLQLLQQQDEWKSDARGKIEIGWQQAKSGKLFTREQTVADLAERKKNWKSRHGR